MADEKKKEETPQPASATTDQTSSGPAVTSAEALAEEAGKTQTYYLRPGAKHMAIVKGQRVTLDKPGQTTDMTASQYKAFSDKFLTKKEYDALKDKGEAPADGASAAGTPDRATMDQASIEDHNAANNEPAKGKTTAAGEPGKPKS